MGLTPSLDQRAVAAIEALERGSGLRVPAAVREWYCVSTAVDWLGDRRGNFLVASHELGQPVDDIDYLARGQLVTETDCQFCCRWAVEIVRDAADDPPVWLIDPMDGDPFTERYADRFTDYVLTSVWDACLPADAITKFDHPLPARALNKLRQRFTELPPTYAWAGSQGCDAVYRFDGTAQVTVAVEAENALYSVVNVDDDDQAAELLAILGLHRG